MRTLSIEVAKSLRQRGLLLPCKDKQDQYYETKRLGEIAIRMQELMKEFDNLDNELDKMEPNGDNN